MKKRILTLVLTLCMVLTLLPTVALAADYNIWVGGVQVTDTNKGDVLGDGGSVQYNGSGVLTLNNATIIGSDVNINSSNGNYGIATSISNLTINLIGENTVVAYGNFSNSCGIYSSGSIAIKEDSSSSGSLAAIGGTVSSGTGYGINAATIDYQSGLLIAKGEKATNTAEKDSAAPLTGAWTTDTKFAVWGPTSTYKVITGTPGYPSTIGLDLTSGTHDSKTLDADGYTWNGSTLTLKNIIINVPIAPSYVSDLYGLKLPAVAEVKLEGVNIINTGNVEYANNNSYAVYSDGDITIENGTGVNIGTLYALAGRATTGDGCGIAASDLTVNSGKIIAIGGKYTYSGTSAGIKTTSTAAITGGKVVTISNSSNSYGYGIRSYGSITISGGTTIAAGPYGSNPAPDMSGYSGSASSGSSGSNYFKIGVKSTTPTATSANATIAKTNAIQGSISFTLTTYPTGTYKVYNTSTVGTALTDVTATLSGSTLTLNHASDLLAGVYYVSVIETDKLESDRLALTVGAYVPPTSNTPPALKSGVAATATASKTVGTAYTLDLSTIFEDADSDMLTYTVAIDGAAAVSADTSYSYTPASAGSYTLLFKANDGTADSTDTYTVTLTAIAPPPAPSYDAGPSYNYYTIKASAGEGGSISSAGGTSYREGQGKRFAVTPDEGCIIFDVLVDGVSVGPVSEYEFENIQKRHTIEVIFAKGDMANFKMTGEYAGYPDVDEGKWYGTEHEGAVHDATLLGIVEGDGTDFRPEDGIKLSEVVKMAAVVWNTYFGSPYSFDQAEGTHWYDTYVNFAVKYGVIKADDFTDYERNATREEMAYIFAHALPESELAAISTTIPPDVAESDEYGAEIWILYAAGVLCGNDEAGTFTGKRGIIRAEAAAIISRMALPSVRSAE